MSFRVLPLIVSLLFASPSWAIDPAEIIVLFNSNVPESREVAVHYQSKRAIPEKNLIGLPLPDREEISRADYDRLLAGPLREKLKQRFDRIRVLLTVYGVPLRVGNQSPTAAEQAKLDKLKPELEAARTTLKELEAATPPDPGKIAVAKAAVDRLAQTERLLSHAESKAAIDSELMLLAWPAYPLDRWLLNPLYFQVPEEARRGKPPVLMTARLDGPSPAIAKRLVDDAIAVEAKGLRGKVYIDARGIKFDAKNSRDGGTGYGGYDESFRELAALLKSGGLDVTLDDTNTLFAADSCPDAAIYTGWYSHAKFIPSNRFVPGAVAWHLASSEAITLRNDKSTVWCPNLLKAGVAATIGPVAEPYTVGFPKPAEFFAYLATGKYPLVECYARTVMLTSWMGVLVGDPLYTPFAKNPVLKPEQIEPSPKGTRLRIGPEK